MATDYEKVRVIDPRLACSDKVKFAVEKGAMNITPSQYKAISATTSIHTFNINVPSQETIIAREVYWKSTINFVVETTKMPAAGQRGANALKMMYGRTDSFSPFPLHSCVNTMTTTINNNSITVNIRELLPAMLRVLDLKSLAKYEATTPVLFDQIADYNDCVKYDRLTGLNIPATAVFASNTAGQPANTQITPIQFDNTPNAPTQATSYPLNPLGAGLSSDFDGIKPRGTFRLTNIKDITAADPAIPNSKFLITAEIVEPLLMSPWLFGGDYMQNCAGIYGIANMNFQFTIGDLSRMWRYANLSNTVDRGLVKTVSWSTDPANPPFVDSQLLFTFLTPHASNLLSPVNCIPYMDLPIFKTSGFDPFPAAVKDAAGTVSYTKKSIISTSLQLNQIPDALIIFVKKSQLSNYEPDWFLCINQIQITWNGGAGYLVNATPYDLWKMSVSNGSNQSWEEFSGSMNGVRPFNTAYLLDSQTREVGIGKPSESHIPTSGSILYLKFGKDIQLIEDYYAAGSLGNFNLQVRLEVFNQTFNDVAASAADMVIIAKNSGIIHTTRGTTSLYTGLLTKEDVMQANSLPYYTGNDVKRMVGGGWWDSIKTGIAHVLPKVPSIAKSILGHFKDDHHLAKMGHDALHAAGFGKSGGKKAIDERIM